MLVLLLDRAEHVKEEPDLVDAAKVLDVDALVGEHHRLR